ncbi:MAG TPA: HAMP domain-containing sensor histidine kinase [Clostridia bacterium]|nr:HAMP domain-containing sensor histidine kinase [Clostridia bacterium]
MSIRKRMTMGFIFVIILTVLILEILIINIVRVNYYNNLRANLQNQLKVSCELYSRYFSDATLSDNVLNNVDTFWKQSNAQVQIIDTDGKVLMDSIGYMPGSKERLPDVEEALKTGTGAWFGKADYDSNGIMAVSQTLKSDGETVGVLRFISTLKEVNEDVYAVARVFIVIGIIVAFVSAFLSLLISNTIVNPLKKVTEVAAKMASGDYHIRSVRSYNDEIGKLSDTFNYLAEEIDKRDRMKNDFISSISHELRTPLTSIKGWAVTLMEVADEEAAGEEAAGEEAAREEAAGGGDVGDSAEIRNEHAEGGRNTEESRNAEVSRDTEGNWDEEVSRDAEESRDVRTVAAVKSENRELFATGLDIIEKECDRLTQMVEELLDFSRLTSGKLSIKNEKVMLSEFVDTVGRQLTPRAARDGLNFDVKAQDGLPEIISDANRLKQVIINILDNAFRFTPAGGIVLFKTEVSGGEIIFTVNDTGCGIPADEMPYIKEKFFKGKNSKLGNGIGLSICDEIIRLMNGSLSIYSMPGKGTSVVIRIPAVMEGSTV